jgi:hypothetical protein
MKTKTTLFIAFAILFLFTTCKKDNNPINEQNPTTNQLHGSDSIVSGVLYTHYVEPVISETKTIFNINGTNYNFSSVEAGYICYSPTLKKNVFYMFLTSAEDKNKEIYIQVFTDLITASEFFTDKVFNIDMITINTNGSEIRYSDINASFGWQNVNYNSLGFSGLATLTFKEPIFNTTDSKIYYPSQSISVSFNNRNIEN